MNECPNCIGSDALFRYDEERPHQSLGPDPGEVYRAGIPGAERGKALTIQVA